MFSPISKALNLNSRVKAGRLLQSPLVDGTWALIEPAGQQNHAAQLCWINKHRLACVWMAGGQEGTSGMSIYTSELRQGKNTWSKPKKISQDTNRSEQNPLLFVIPEEKYKLIHTSQFSRDPKDKSWQENKSSFSMQWTAKLRQQHKGLSGNRWSRAKDLLEKPAFCRHPPFRREDGYFLLPIYRSLETGGAFGHDHSEVLLLDPHGNPTDQIFDVPNSTGRVHGSIVLSADRTILLQFFRSRLADRIYCSKGNLEGNSWSEPEPINLPNNNSSIQACRLSNGMLAMIYNRFALEEEPINPKEWGDANWPRTRWPLSIAISEDDGNSWPWCRDIDSGLGFCGAANWHLNGQLAYPTLIEGLPGQLHIAYSWAARAAIRYLCLDISNITGDFF